MKHVAALMDAGKLNHADAANALMTCIMSNVVSRTDAKDKISPAKERSKLKTDGPEALIMALAMGNVSAHSVCETRGLIVLG